MPSHTKIPACALTLEQRKATRKLARIFNKGKDLEPIMAQAIANRTDCPIDEVWYIWQVMQKTKVDELAANVAELAFDN